MGSHFSAPTLSPVWISVKTVPGSQAGGLRGLSAAFPGPQTQGIHLLTHQTPRCMQLHHGEKSDTA